jgi:RNA polymerase sigma-70 factor (ECF subfamily)
MIPLERKALSELVSEHQASMRRLAVRLTGSLESADEIIQEGLLRMVSKWGGFRGQSTFKTWAFRVLLNVFHDWLAKRRPASPIQDSIDPRQADPALCAMAEELRRYVAARVSALPPRQREVLVLMVYEGLTAEEVAQLLEIQVANVYASLYQARRRLRVELAPFLENPDGRCPVSVTDDSRPSQEKRHA